MGKYCNMMTVEEIYSKMCECSGVTTDSRKCGAGLMFFALKGERFDGNEYVRGALEQGCNYAVMDNAELCDCNDRRMILVDNVLQTLQQVAALHRRCWGKTVIGITGTNGKTTTKELTAAVLSSAYNILYTQGNLNNSIGVPLTLLQLRPEHEYAIVEMGASHPGDIRELVEICRPDYGIITNVGSAHLLGFGSFEGVKRTKGELYDWLRGHKGCAIVNNDDNDLMQMVCGLPTIKYGHTPTDALMVHGELMECNPFVKFRWRLENGKWHVVQTNLIGAYNVDNALAAITAALKLGVSEESVCTALGAYVPHNNRSQLTRTEHNTLVVDAYNANPSSMTVALKSFNSMNAPCKMLILGDMRELGAASESEHRRIVRLIAEYGFERVWLVGQEFGKVAVATSYRVFADVDEVIDELGREPVCGVTVLIKGSNSIGLTRLVDKL